MTFPFRRVEGEINVLQMRRGLEAAKNLFGEIDFRARVGSPHAEMRDIWVRYNALENLNKEDPAAFNGPHESVWYPSADKIDCLHRVVFDVMYQVKGERLGGILITKLPPGGEIKPHHDTGWHAEHYSKFCIPIQADPGCRFSWDAGHIDEQPGIVHWFRNDVMHWIKNDSTRDRVVMILCAQSSLYPVKGFDDAR